MSWHFSRALVEAYSEANSSDGGPSARSKSTTTHAASSSPDRTTDVSNRFPSLQMSRNLTDVRGEELLTWYREVFLARTFQPRERVQELTGSAAGFGGKWHASFAKWDPATSSWRTPQCSLFEGWDVFSETWPRWGMMRDGECSEPVTQARRTDENASGLLPTPSASCDSKPSPKWNPASQSGRSLATRALLNIWPTPTASDAKGSSPASLTRKDGRTRANDRLDHRMMAEHGGKLNPTWVEKLMGWPKNWTDTKPMSDKDFISWFMGFCECEETRTREVMRVLRRSDEAQEFQRQAGRPVSIQEAEVLLPVLLEHQEGSNETWLLMEGAEAPQGKLRGVRLQACATGSPRRSGHQKQPTGEHPDAMQALPRFLAYDGKEAWASGRWEDAIPRVTQGVTDRVDRLRAIGNGQVPAVVRLAWHTLLHRSAMPIEQR